MSTAPSASSRSQVSIETEKEKVAPSQAPNDVVHQHDIKEETSSEDLQELETLSKIATSDFPHSFKLAFIIMALVLSIFLVALDMTIVATAIPRITDEFHSLNQVGWYGAAFFLTVGSFQSTWGKAYKYFPLKPSFLVAIGIFELGSLICGVAQNSVTLIIGRAIAGKHSGPHLFGVLADNTKAWVEPASPLVHIPSSHLRYRQEKGLRSLASWELHMDALVL